MKPTIQVNTNTFGNRGSYKAKVNLVLAMSSYSEVEVYDTSTSECWGQNKNTPPWKHLDLAF